MATSEAAAAASVTTKPPRQRRQRKEGRALGIYTAIVLLYLFLPIFVMILFGFNDHVGRFNFAFQGFTLKWYKAMFDVPELNTALRNSLVIGVVATAVSTVFGTMIALALARHGFKGRSAVNVMIFMPMATPEIVMGVSLLALFLTMGLARGIGTLMIAHIMFCISYVVVTVRARLAGFDDSLEDAAQDLGATPWTTFWTVTFPLVFPGILAGALLAFALSLDDFVISSFVNGGQQTFPLWVYGASRIGVPAQVNVWGTVIFMTGVIYAAWVMRSNVKSARASRRGSNR